MLRVGIVGCGKIADAHAFQINKIQGCQLVGACDAEPLMARQLSERFHANGWYTNLSDLLNEARPDVVHITTPPESHYKLAQLCLEHGCHVYVEKPFTLNEDDAKSLVALAGHKGLKITAGHDGQFSHVARRMRALVQAGYLGGTPVHMESYYCYEFGDSSYSRALLSDKQHWVRRLPGGLLHNIISHGIARITEFLKTDSPHVIAHGFVSPYLRCKGEEEIIDELRVIISEEGMTTAYFTFSSQMRPLLHQFRLYGPKNGLILDQDQETLITLRGAKYKSYLEHFVPPIVFAKQYLQNLEGNIGRFLRRDFHMTTGMHYLIGSFYRSITTNEPVPIPYREIVLTARIMDQIFEQLKSSGLSRPDRTGVGNLSVPSR